MSLSKWILPCRNQCSPSSRYRYHSVLLLQRGVNISQTKIEVLPFKSRRRLRGINHMIHGNRNNVTSWHEVVGSSNWRQLTWSKQLFRHVLLIPIGHVCHPAPLSTLLRRCRNYQSHPSLRKSESQPSSFLISSAPDMNLCALDIYATSNEWLYSRHSYQFMYELPCVNAIHFELSEWFLHELYSSIHERIIVCVYYIGFSWSFYIPATATKRKFWVSHFSS